MFLKPRIPVYRATTAKSGGYLVHNGEVRLDENIYSNLQILAEKLKAFLEILVGVEEQV